MGSPLPGEPHEQPGWETGREKGVPVTPEGSSALELCFLPSPPSVRGWKPPPPSALHAGAEINEITFNYSHYFPWECWSERQHLAVSYSRALPFLLPLKPLPGAPGSCLQPLDTHGAAAPSRQDERRGQEGKDPDRAKGEGRAGGSRGQGWGLAGVRAHSQAGLTCPFPDHLQLEEPSERGERGSAGGWGGFSHLHGPSQISRRCPATGHFHHTAFPVCPSWEVLDDGSLPLHNWENGWDPLPGGRCCLSSPHLERNCQLFFPV